MFVYSLYCYYITHLLTHTSKATSVCQCTDKNTTATHYARVVFHSSQVSRQLLRTTVMGSSKVPLVLSKEDQFSALLYDTD